MRNQVLLLAAVAVFALAFVAGSDAQPPGKKGVGKKGFGRAVTVEQIVDRIMAFDKNDDGKVTMDEIPERMQHLIAMGDVNKDGVLDKDEIQKLARTMEAFTSLASPPGFGGPKGGPKGDGFKGGGPKGGGPKGGGFFGGPKGPDGAAMRTVDDLNLSGSTKSKAVALVKTHQDKLRKLEDMARAELMVKMKDVLTTEDYKAFQAGLDRPFGPASFGTTKPQDLAKRLDQYQKELEELRRNLPK